MFSAFGEWDFLNVIPRNFKARDISIPACLDLKKGQFINLKTFWGQFKGTPPPCNIPQMLEGAGLCFTGREHNALDDISNCRKILTYLDAKGITLKPDCDESSATLALAGPLTEPLELEISQGELAEMGNAFLCHEKFEGEK